MIAKRCNINLFIQSVIMVLIATSITINHNHYISCLLLRTPSFYSSLFFTILHSIPQLYTIRCSSQIELLKPYSTLKNRISIYIIVLYTLHITHTCMYQVIRNTNLQFSFTLYYVKCKSKLYILCAITSALDVCYIEFLIQSRKIIFDKECEIVKVARYILL